MIFAKKNIAGLVWQRMGLSTILMPDNMTGAETHVPKTAHAQPQPKREHPPAVSEPVQKIEIPVVSKPLKPRFLPIEQWPEHWKRRFEQTRKGKIGWTYWSLGQDLTSSNSDEAKKKRGNFMRRFFHDLAFPQGTHTFWPASLPDPTQNGLIEANPDVFWAALRGLGSRAVVIMGSAAAKALLEEQRLKPMTAYHKPGFLIWVLWEIDTLATDEGKYRQALGFMKKALGNFTNTGN